MRNPFIRLFHSRDKPRDAISAAPSFYFGTSGAGKSVTVSSAIQAQAVAEDFCRVTFTSPAPEPVRLAVLLIRWRNDIKPGMWVLFQNEKWTISTLGEYSFRRKYLGLKASIAKGVSG